MTDIVSQTGDIGLSNTDVMKAGNILSTQLGSLTYLQDFGIDLNYFLSEEFAFQNESFKSYLIQRLSNSGINVSSVIEVIENLYTKYTLNIAADQGNNGLVAR
jgi:hypothetical protein